MPVQRFSPREFLKGRRPERFSDSVGQDSPVLDRSLLEYHLDTLTNRSEELHFETFTRRLLECTVCPNLLPHTGPTGGGDSKVDTETYPVAETLTMGWYIGIGDQAATERWAFAFSAKKDWRPKLKSDVAKIVTTGRGYTKAFFVSNQYIRDKDRAEIEDELRKEYGLDVRVFDRTWLLDKVFGGRLEQLAIDELGLKTSVRREFRKGPLDTEREQALESVEARIAAALQDNRHTLGLVNDCLEAADLARGLERPRTEVEGFYARADRLAKQFGAPHQRVQSAYDRAWTAFWWYEDYHLFSELYADVEERARGSRNAYDLELWTNLFFMLHGAVSGGELKAEGQYAWSSNGPDRSARPIGAGAGAPKHGIAGSHAAAPRETRLGAAGRNRSYPPRAGRRYPRFRIARRLSARTARADPDRVGQGPWHAASL
jgi:hypothetical protein